MHLVFIDCGVMSSEAIRPMIYCVMCCEYVGPRERTEKTMNCCIYSYFCLVKFCFLYSLLLPHRGEIKLCIKLGLRPPTS